MQQEPEPWLVLLKLIRVAKAAATVEAEAGATEALLLALLEKFVHSLLNFFLRKTRIEGSA